MKFETELITPDPTPYTRRVVIELPVGRAKSLADAINANIEWHETDVEDELDALHAALMGWSS